MKIGIIALSSALKQGEDISESVSVIESWGHELIFAKNCFDQKILCPNSDTLLAGTIQARIDGLYEIWDQADIIWSLRGGYGAVQILEFLDYEFFSNRPKILCGYSDLTALFLALHSQSNLNTFFHCPMLFEFSGLKEEEKLDLKSMFADPDNFRKTQKIIRGGNLSLITALIGSPYFKGFESNEILFLEECKEPAYKVERMLYQLYHAGLFQNIDELWIGKEDEAVFNIDFLHLIREQYNFEIKLDKPYGHASKMVLRLS